MAEFVKETALGFRRDAGGESGREWTHVILSRTEYLQEQEERKELSAQVYRAKYDAEENRKAANERLAAAITETREARQEQERLKAQIKREQLEAQYQRWQNQNLLRISRERANAARGLQPKKEHCGYVVLSSEEKQVRVERQENWHETINAWETKVQTPYSVEFSAEHVRGLLKEELAAFLEPTALDRIGINWYCPEGYAKFLAQLEDPSEAEEYNAAFEQRLSANYRTGYWEAILRHTKPLGMVPGEMRPAKKKSAPKTGEKK